MRFVDVIEKKKAGEALSKEEIHAWIEGYVNNNIPDYQVSALLMAICFQGMNMEETSSLCEAMLHSGEVMDLSKIVGAIADKHSTGGVGDKTSLALAPMVAACGVHVAKMSGRGLGHTGGTLDKMEAIEGFQIDIPQTSFIQQINDIGLAIIGQSAQLVPADKLLYALRDVSGTVNSMPLIATSIMSKKLAAGADTILLDVKFGEGAFMKNEQEAKELANIMIQLGEYFHKDTRAILSNMNQPLGNAIGNALEVKEAIDTLQGKGPEDFQELCLQAGSIMLLQNHMATSEQEARKQLQVAIDSGAALDKFIQMVKRQGGNIEQILHPETLPQAKAVIAMASPTCGFIKELHAMQLGSLAMKLGAGRMVKTDIIDPSVGIVLQKKAGDYVEQGDILAYIHTNAELSQDWQDCFYQSFLFVQEPVQKQPLIMDILMRVSK